ncbi:hypothetical protein IWX90DRAFT_423996 [Phyllosticta citrichinensis]|uniref:Pal1 cell morphology n=1 Tax=Phyllosticta citrichinensis TaxID=1130410 RepID=A0ABR1Y2L0_9PEZI
MHDASHPPRPRPCRRPTRPHLSGWQAQSRDLDEPFAPSKLVPPHLLPPLFFNFLTSSPHLTTPSSTMEPHHADSKAAQEYLINPLVETEPSEETGPGSHFRSTFAPAEPLNIPSPPSSASKDRSMHAFSSRNPYRKSSGGSHAGSHRSRGSHGSHGSHSSVGSNFITPPSSASPSQSRFPQHRERADSHVKSPRERRGNSFSHSPSMPSGRPRRSSSLRARYPGDKSTHPLDQLSRENKQAHRSHHLKKRHIPGPDTIDKLDSVMSRYHHEGPYDATLLARNTSWETSPVAALSDSNAEALKATPAENIRDALERHRPIDGVAIIPPGHQDRFGRTYDYKEGDDMMIYNGANFRRWPGVEYHPDDIKGKGEPSYSLDEAMKRMKLQDRDGIEMRTRPRNKTVGHVEYQGVYPGPNAGGSSTSGYRDWEQQGVHRSNSTGRNLTAGLRKRFGSLKKKNRKAEAAA